MADINDNLGEFYRAWKEEKKDQKIKYLAEELPKDIALLESLDDVRVVQHFNDGQHWVMIVNTERGIKEVDYYPSTGYWKVREGRASGKRIGNLQKYFRLGVKNDSSTSTET